MKEASYRWYRKKHDNQSLLTEHRMLHKGVHKAGEAFSSFFEKHIPVSCKMISVNLVPSQLSSIAPRRSIIHTLDSLRR